MKFSQFIRDYFTFTRNERRGITVLLVIIVLLGIANKFYFYLETPGKIELPLFDSLTQELGRLNDSVSQASVPKRLFRFDPNTIDSSVLLTLDIPERTAQNLLKYRTAGGHFDIPADLKKIFGMDDETFGRLESFVVIKEKEEEVIQAEEFMFDPNVATDDDFRRLGLSDRQIRTIRNYQSKGGIFKNKEDFMKIWGLNAVQKDKLSTLIAIREKSRLESVKPAEKSEMVKLDLNSADSTDLEKLPGIGDKLSKRIVKYREALGGYHSLEQLKEVYGLRPETISLISNRLSVNSSDVQRIDFNFSDYQELAKHPYIRKKLAAGIIDFRTRYGKISSLEILRDSMILNIDEYKRLKPYF